MGRKLEDLAHEALQLDAASRAALARQLLESLETPTPEEHEKLWVEESLRRYAELRDGRTTRVEAEEVFDRIADRPKR